jgi:hypothetical protein
MAIDRVVFESRASAACDEQLLNDFGGDPYGSRRVVTEVNPTVQWDLLASL